MSIMPKNQYVLHEESFFDLLANYKENVIRTSNNHLYPLYILKTDGDSYLKKGLFINSKGDLHFMENFKWFPLNIRLSDTNDSLEEIATKNPDIINEQTMTLMCNFIRKELEKTN